MKNVFGKYELLGEIGHGSSARVYKARIGSGRPVALKIFDLGKGSAGSTAVQRFFENELKHVCSMTHPNIITYLDAGTVDEVPYLAMELLAAGSLELRLQRTAYLTVDDAIAMLEPIADAVDYAHERRLLHRDIKPSNILFGDDGRPVLADFGIAHVLPSREEVTVTREQVPGTTDFMAPEVMNEAPASPSSDIYSLGMTVYFALAGKLPSEGKTLFSRSRARVEGHVIALSERNPTISLEVSRAVMCAIATEPKNRYKSARAFAASLRVSTSAMSVSAQPPEAAKKSKTADAKGKESGEGGDIATQQISVPANFADKYPEHVERLSKHQLIYSIAGLVLGLACVIGGIVLFLHGVSGSTGWTANLLGAESKVSDAAPGAVLFIVGLFIVFLTRYVLTIKR